MKDDTKKLITGLAVGAIAGAVAGILFAPKSGKETRADIAKYMHEMKDLISKELAAAGSFTKEKYSQIVQKVVKVYEASKKISSKDAQEIKEMLEDNYEEVKKAASEKK